MKLAPFFAVPPAMFVLWAANASAEQAVTLPPPLFHHLHLNSVDPDAAIAFYVKTFPATSRTSWAGFPALASPNHVLVLFTKVVTPPAADAEATAYWHFGWHVEDARNSVAFYLLNGVRIAPFYTGDADGSVRVSSDTWPYPPGVNGRTKAQIAEAKASGIQPRGVGGNGYVFGPDGAVIEFSGNGPARFDHVHMYEDEPICAQHWYEKHLNAPIRPVPPGVSDANCDVARTADPSWPSLLRQGTFRAPSGGVNFGDVSMAWYPNQRDKPLTGTQGHLIDHVGLSVGNLDAWVAKLRSEGVTFLKQPYQLGDSRAVMIEGPSHEAIELVEVK
jgi:catechol 2,3-dioxygenase-like lactoylglutathione lyase family enzyme